MEFKFSFTLEKYYRENKTVNTRVIYISVVCPSALFFFFVFFFCFFLVIAIVVVCVWLRFFVLFCHAQPPTAVGVTEGRHSSAGAAAPGVGAPPRAPAYAAAGPIAGAVKSAR